MHDPCTMVHQFRYPWPQGEVFMLGTENLGAPSLSNQPPIVLGMFWSASFEHFGKSRRKAQRFMRKHLFDILHFAENPIDSAASVIGYRFHERDREDRIAAAEAMIYGCVLRWTRPWYRHPRWHVHHWRLQIHPLQKLRRRLFVRCCYCAKPFGWNEAPIGNWGGDRLWHSACDRSMAGIRCEPVEESA